MATSSDINLGYEPLEADLCITKSWQRDQVMGITFMVQTKQKKKKSLLSFQNVLLQCCQTHIFTWAFCPKEEEEEAKTSLLANIILKKPTLNVNCLS